ncbi:MAG TPA: ABC transporter substrate-binding protein [Gaiellaceae bacterium]|nr:ABC transporter substrate-binding protein [Gaiellaceae bacterium]
MAVLVVLVLAACGSNGAPQASPTQAAAPPAEPFPVTVESAGAPVTIATRPERIVSLSPTATESLFAIHAGDQVVAVDDQSNYPAEAPHSKLSGYQPNVEAIAGYRPDLVVAAFDPSGLVKGLRKLGIPVLLQPAATNLGEAYAEIEALGLATGHEPGAKAVVKRMRARIAELVASASAGKSIVVYHELGPDYFSATSKTFIGSIYKLLGAENIADGAGGKAPDYPQLSAEYILSANPDVIVLSDTKCCGQSPETVAGRPGWSKIAAVRNGHVIPVDDDIASRWGPRTVDFVEIVARAIAEAGSP